MIAMRTRSLAVLMVTAVLAVLGAAALHAQGADARVPGNTGVSCFQYGCDFQDPAATGCDADAETLQDAPIIAVEGGQDVTLGSVELRWSPTCQTNWARVTSTSGASSTNHVLQVAIQRQSDGTFEELDTEGSYVEGYPRGGGGGNGPAYHGVASLYTDMLYSPGPARAVGWILPQASVIGPIGIAAQYIAPLGPLYGSI
jgi:Protein of unknown function (DUF2690)